MKDVKDISAKLTEFLAASKKYLPVLFVLLLLAVYGFLMYQVQALNSQEPDSSALSAQSQTAQVPHIDQAALAQLKNLQDNSVSVQSLFNGARSNPFQE